MRRTAFTLIELLVVVTIIIVLLAMLMPAIQTTVRAAERVQCASNQRQLLIGLIHYRSDHRGRLPVREGPNFSRRHPHVLQDDAHAHRVDRVMLEYVGAPDVFYCPANAQGRSPETHWPATVVQSGHAIVSTYQFPFWVDESRWLVDKPARYARRPDRSLLADFLGGNRNGGRLYNHRLGPDGWPVGMNVGYVDGGGSWADQPEDGWLAYIETGDWRWHLPEAP